MISMATKTKRGRPPKGRQRVKAQSLDVRLGLPERTTFKDAAELAGLDLSAWVRQRLRLAARKELEAAGLPVAFLQKRNGKSRSRSRGLTNDELRKFAGKHQPPQWWYDKDEDLSSPE